MTELISVDSQFDRFLENVAFERQVKYFNFALQWCNIICLASCKMDIVNTQILSYVIYSVRDLNIQRGVFTDFKSARANFES